MTEATPGPALALSPAGDHDLDFLTEMLAEAAFWRADTPVPPLAEILTHRDLAVYVDGWGRPGDAGLLARVAGVTAGAVWVRRFDTNVHGYGFIEPDIPELTIAVRAEYRGRGLGRALLWSMLAQQAMVGSRAVSLSVEDDNPARALYESCGFAVHATGAGARTLLRRLEPRAPDGTPDGG